MSNLSAPFHLLPVGARFLLGPGGPRVYVKTGAFSATCRGSLATIAPDFSVYRPLPIDEVSPDAGEQWWRDYAKDQQS